MKVTVTSIAQPIGAQERAVRQISALADSPTQTVEVARDRSAAAVQQFCEELMDELTASMHGGSSAEAAGWVKQRYTELALEFAKSVRDLETDAGRRHDIAQAIQYKILESERRLRSLLDALTAPGDSSGSA